MSENLRAGIAGRQVARGVKRINLIEFLSAFALLRRARTAPGFAKNQPGQPDANQRCRNGILANHATDRIDNIRSVRSDGIKRTKLQLLRIQTPVKRIHGFIQLGALAVDIRLDFLRRARAIRSSMQRAARPFCRGVVGSRVIRLADAVIWSLTHSVFSRRDSMVFCGTMRSFLSVAIALRTNASPAMHTSTPPKGGRSHAAVLPSTACANATATAMHAVAIN